MKITNLYIYPIKSCQGIELSKAQVTPKGLQNNPTTPFYDREFMLIDSQGNFLTQREYPLLATIQIKIEGDRLFLKNKNIESLIFTPTLEGKEIKVKIWGDRTIAIDQGNEVAQWFNQALQLSGKNQCRLVRQSNHYTRLIDSKYSTSPNQSVSFADGYPILLTNTASLAELNRRLQEKYGNESQKIQMNRFRPNIVIETDQPFIESTWENLKIGEVELTIVKPCTRCIVTTTDQFTGKRNPQKEPLITLSTFRQIKNQGIMFGENMIPEKLGIINVGDSFSSPVSR